MEDAIQHAVNYCQKKNNFKIKNFIILLCNSICVRSDDIKKGIKILKNNKTIDTVTTVSKFNNFSPVRTKKIEGKTKNYIPNDSLKIYSFIMPVEIRVCMLTIAHNHLQLLEPLS